MIPAQQDEFGREIQKPIDTWGPRRGIALSLTQLAPYLDPEAIGSLIEFFVSSSLGDRREEVRKEMLNAALKIVDLHGKVCTYMLNCRQDKFLTILISRTTSRHFCRCSRIFWTGLRNRRSSIG